METYNLYKGDTVEGTGSKGEMFSQVKHHCQDGLFTLTDSDTWFTLVLYREDGIVYPIAGLPCMGDITMDSVRALSEANWEEWLKDAKKNLTNEIAELCDQDSAVAAT